MPTPNPFLGGSGGRNSTPCPKDCLGTEICNKPWGKRANSPWGREWNSCLPLSRAEPDPPAGLPSLPLSSAWLWLNFTVSEELLMHHGSIFKAKCPCFHEGGQGAC